MKNQTAVEWLIEQLTEVERKNWINNKILSIGKNTLAKQTFDGIIEQAKEMEKQQIIDFAENYALKCITCSYSGEAISLKDSVTFYNETFKQN